MSNRRDFLKKGTLLGLSGLASSLIGKNKIDQIETVSEQFAGEGTLFTLPKLPYSYDALEPFIDKQTMEIHYSKHHQAYVDKLNAAATPQNIDFKVDDAAKCKNITASSLPAIRNNLGGHYNHSLFWTLLKPNPTSQTNLPSGKLAEALNKSFSNFDSFKKEFSDKALKIFGSGWCWLILDDTGALKITTTPNQDNILMQVATDKGMPVLALDVWEHAYYLKYQNKRADYISNWWNIINWEKAEALYTAR
jgi:superoxide dismutase, Fe-Mn family